MSPHHTAKSKSKFSLGAPNHHKHNRTHSPRTYPPPLASGSTAPAPAPAPAPAQMTKGSIQQAYPHLGSAFSQGGGVGINTSASGQTWSQQTQTTQLHSQLHTLSRAEQRKIRLWEVEQEMALEEAEAFKMTEEHLQTLLRPFACVKAEFADLDGLRWTQAAVKRFQLATKSYRRPTIRITPISTLDPNNKNKGDLDSGSGSDSFITTCTTSAASAPLVNSTDKNKTYVVLMNKDTDVDLEKWEECDWEVSGGSTDWEDTIRGSGGLGKSLGVPCTSSSGSNAKSMKRPLQPLTLAAQPRPRPPQRRLETGRGGVEGLFEDYPPGMGTSEMENSPASSSAMKMMMGTNDAGMTKAAGTSRMRSFGEVGSFEELGMDRGIRGEEEREAGRGDWGLGDGSEPFGGLGREWDVGYDYEGNGSGSGSGGLRGWDDGDECAFDGFEDGREDSGVEEDDDEGEEGCEGEDDTIVGGLGNQEGRAIGEGGRGRRRGGRRKYVPRTPPPPGLTPVPSYDWAVAGGGGGITEEGNDDDERRKWGLCVWGDEEVGDGVDEDEESDITAMVDMFPIPSPRGGVAQARAETQEEARARLRSLLEIGSATSCTPSSSATSPAPAPLIIVPKRTSPPPPPLRIPATGFLAMTCYNHNDDDSALIIDGDGDGDGDLTARPVDSPPPSMEVEELVYDYYDYDDDDDDETPTPSPSVGTYDERAKQMQIQIQMHMEREMGREMEMGERSPSVAWIRSFG